MLNENKSLIENSEYNEIVEIINIAHDTVNRVRNIVQTNLQNNL